LSKEQVFDLVRQMPPDQKREMLRLLAGDGTAQREKRQEFAEQQPRRLCAKRGLNWDTMSSEQRENLIDDLIHEDRPCSQ
jgi:hypothetical protein